MPPTSPCIPDRDVPAHDPSGSPDTIPYHPPNCILYLFGFTLRSAHLKTVDLLVSVVNAFANYYYTQQHRSMPETQLS